MGDDAKEPVQSVQVLIILEWKKTLCINNVIFTSFYSNEMTYMYDLGLWAQEVCHCCGLLQARKGIDQGGSEMQR